MNDKEEKFWEEYDEELKYSSDYNRESIEDRSILDISFLNDLEIAIGFSKELTDPETIYPIPGCATPACRIIKE